MSKRSWRNPDAPSVSIRVPDSEKQHPVWAFVSTEMDITMGELTEIALNDFCAKYARENGQAQDCSTTRFNPYNNSITGNKQS